MPSAGKRHFTFVAYENILTLYNMGQRALSHFVKYSTNINNFIYIIREAGKIPKDILFCKFVFASLHFREYCSQGFNSHYLPLN